jgi:glycosyltransferase involved in cell wall biosynthesis
MLGYLKRCCASVADQQGPTVEHIVIDGGSTDGTREWLNQQKAIRSVVEKDRGLYDAVNKGMILSRGKIVAQLNCDEQYLPGALQLIKDYFEAHPDVDVVFGQFLFIRPDGSLIAYRKTYPVRWYYIMSSYLYAFTCAMFIRRRILNEVGLFNTSLKCAADQDFVLRMLRSGHRVGYLKRFLSAFTMTGRNVSGRPEALAELHELRKTYPLWVRVLRFALNIARYTERLLTGAYREKMPLNYAIYGADEATERRVYRVRRAAFRLWRGGGRQIMPPREKGSSS